MKPQEIKEFLKSLRKTDIEELEYKSGDDSLYFKKSNVSHIIRRESVSEAEPVIEQPSVAETETIEKNSIVPIKSNVVGIFSNIIGEDKLPTAKGSKIKVGQKVGQIEAMKIVKDVLSGVKGEIVEVLVSNGESVEYGQELILVDTDK
jgi:biotin carboxyl carrier protein